jgi:hypothetical protein
VGRQDDQELHQEFILAAKGQSPFILHVGRQDDQELHQEFILAAKGQ